MREVPIRHPTDPAIAELGLRWYAVPCVSDMILTIGGIDYPCAPFNGFYMGTEIASRNFADENRYDLLPRVARALGEDVDAAGPQLWKDRALTELNRAVLPFVRGGRRHDDRPSRGEPADTSTFAQRERAQGREPSGDWAWIVPPQASAACPVFHLGDARPARDAELLSLARDRRRAAARPTTPTTTARGCACASSARSAAGVGTGGAGSSRESVARRTGF